MLTIGIAEISKNPSLFNQDEIMDIIDKKSKKEKFIAIPAKYRPLLEETIREIEYRQWLEKNAKALGADETSEFEEVYGSVMERV
jgi:hypothetical protein